MQENVAIFRKNLALAQERQKKYKTKELHFEVRDKVFPRVAPKKGVMKFGNKGKLTPGYIGPFEILERIGVVAYRLILPPQFSAMHDVFHISMLQKYLRNPTHVLDYAPLHVHEDFSYKEALVRILDRKVQVLHNKTRGTTILNKRQLGSMRTT
ncbi:uncharacterized protein LOC122296778 [Carya illinoinensis]|uniref:uncharacterized protein LOC122296778 n=1 Tax=Carya illinoinensis TaxID=32201 RepID=UPI001C72259E|nr:uncharacterized protein LOC122296778 [Carya illinoinensis]